MARPRPSNGVTIEQVLDYLTDCDNADVMSVVIAVTRRREALRNELMTKIGNFQTGLAMLDSLVAPKQQQEPPVTP